MKVEIKRRGHLENIRKWGDGHSRVGKTEREKMGVCCLALFFVMRSCRLFVCTAAPGWRAGCWQMLSELFSLFHSMSVCAR